MKLTEHFTLAELLSSQAAARRGLDNTPDADALEALRFTANGLELVRRLAGGPLVVSSGYRSPAVNAAVGGSRTSQHMRGEAADVIAPGMRPLALCRAVEASGIQFDQLIHEHGAWVHVSFVRGRAPRRDVLTIDRRGTRAGLLEARA